MQTPMTHSQPRMRKRIDRKNDYMQHHTTYNCNGLKVMGSRFKMTFIVSKTSNNPWLTLDLLQQQTRCTQDTVILSVRTYHSPCLQIAEGYSRAGHRGQPEGIWTVNCEGALTLKRRWLINDKEIIDDVPI